MPFVWLNGATVEESSASVPLRDAGLLHGAGVFTTMRGRGGAVLWLDRHLRRLRDSCDALFIPLQCGDDALAAAAEDLLRRNELAGPGVESRLRLTVTRGTVQQDPLHGPRVEPAVFLTATTLEPYPAEFYRRGLTVMLMDEQKLNPYDLQAGHKTLNYLSRLAALREANRRGAGEALWFDVHNYLQSGSISNVFLVKDGAIVTPPTPAEMRQEAEVARSVHYPKSAVLPGVTRSVVIDLARGAGIEVRLAGIDVSQLLDADELFLTNSVMHVMPVSRIERKTVGADEPGPVTQRVSQALGRAVGPSSPDPEP